MDYKQTLQAIIKSKEITLKTEKKKSDNIAEYIEGEIAGLKAALELANKEYMEV